MIDTSMKLDNNDTASCLKTVFKFLQILKFPCSFESQLQDDLTKGWQMSFNSDTSFFINRLKNYLR